MHNMLKSINYILGDLNERWKTLKLKEKNINDSVKKSDVLDETFKRRKEASSSLKQEKKELEKKLKNQNKKMKHLRRCVWIKNIFV